MIDVDRQLRAPALSLHSPAAGEEGRALDEIVSNADARDPEAAVASTEMGSIVQSKLKEFERTLRNEREHSIWTLRMTAQDPSSLAEIGEQYGVSKERIRQVEARIKRRLRDFLTQELGSEIAFEFDIVDD